MGVSWSCSWCERVSVECVSAKCVCVWGGDGDGGTEGSALDLLVVFLLSFLYSILRNML